MYDLYTWATPNGFKVSILLEELGQAYNVIPVDIGKGDQFKPDYLKINPNNKMPTLVDPDGPGGKPYSVFESGAILMYLAEKHGKFLPTETGAKYRVIQWLMFQMGGLGPMLGQAHHFLQYAPEKIEYAMNRYANEANRIYGVVERRLNESAYLAGDEYSIADMAVVPWIRRPERQNVNIDDYPATKAWRDAILARPAVVKGCGVLVAERAEAFDDEAKKNLFGSGQYQKR
ncbi:MAG: glutathione S-transferase N-terminal domain-containing protein [Rhodospirillales bacterium]